MKIPTFALMLTNRIVNIGLSHRPSFLLIFSFVLMMVSRENVADYLMNDDVAMKYLTDNNINNFTPYRRNYKLFNHCSERQIEIHGHSITALGLKDSPYSRLILQAAHFQNHFGINIIGERSGRYICFNKKSKLITKFSGSSPRCIFEEKFSPDKMYSMLRSVFNHSWCIGFNRKGKPISGSDHKRLHRKRCYYFTKRDHSYFDGLHDNQEYAPKIPDPVLLSHLLVDDFPSTRNSSSKNVRAKSN